MTAPTEISDLDLIRDAILLLTYLRLEDPPPFHLFFLERLMDF